MSGWTKNGRLSVYKIYMYLHKKSKKIIKYKKKEKLSWKMALPPNESLTSKDGTVFSVLQAHVYMNISHPSWVNTSV